ncbi:hypothetical protein [Ectobacillus ponti]|uniref:Competence protein ComG n=1 Tax=Ectobacillus ponti TaxID=2961894 RepID=A0AA41X4M4_9BACI|nr:hypothetical protein [Ectobacillus ponti]MCP8967098.1 hypothetical protein [Ectobacillus ponti]
MLVEMLASFSLLCMLTALLLPQAVHLLSERKHMRQSYEAALLLKETAAQYREEGMTAGRQAVERGGVVYEIQSTRVDEKRSMVCAIWTSVRNREERRCQALRH